ncbi:ABC transporter substrate-binding protein [Flavivirga spongiicola]|uniref:Helical backbone metal receptor n=1 Tax=Flavivirga spongiicola TaxID=421621 RepID=A0ABU7XPA7_9FLAO|nr:helical backbone metal receptor [Flavivirga sp. MEBiC05379]MDO5977617.1 helical backbone metal receptor [Flavivirga sp. MEBiC05379]
MKPIKTIKDQLNRIIHLKETPKRIVSLVPSQTELLCDLGLENALVGVTKFCVHPHHIRTDAVVVGGTKQIHLDKIRGLQPDIILCNKEENTKDLVEACETICNVHVSDIFIIDDSLKLIHQYGEIFNKTKEAFTIIDTILREIEDFNIFIKNKPRLKAVYFIWKDPWMVAANNTFVNYLLKLNKFENVFENEIRYPEIALNESTVNKDVNIVLLSSEPYPFKEKHKKGIQAFYPNADIVLADGEMFSWYGSRLTKAFKYFKNLRLNLENNQS